MITGHPDSAGCNLRQENFEQVNNHNIIFRAHKSDGNSKFGPSEANAVTNNFNSLGDSDKQHLLNFLRSL